MRGGPDADYAEGVVQLGIVLHVSDIERSVSFYCDHMGFDLMRDEEDAGQDRRVVTLRFGNAFIDLVQGDAPPMARQRYRLFWEVEALRPALRLIVAGGGRVVRQMEYGVYCADPDGNTILVTIREPTPEEMRY